MLCDLAYCVPCHHHARMYAHAQACARSHAHTHIPTRTRTCTHTHIIIIIIIATITPRCCGGGRGARSLQPNEINFNRQLQTMYTREIVPIICKDGDDGQYGSSASAVGA